MEFVVALLLALAAAPDMPDATAPQLPAGNLTHVDPATIQRMLIDYGYRAIIDRTNPDDVVIEGQLTETIFVVLFYGCEKGTDCTGIEFATGYDFPDGLDPTHLNSWNRDVRFGAAYLDDQDDPVLTMDVNFAGDGIGQENFADWLNLWSFLVEDFEAHLDLAPPPTDAPDFIEPRSNARVYEIGLKGIDHAPFDYLNCSPRGTCR